MLQVNWGSTENSSHSSPNSTLQGAPDNGVVSPNVRNSALQLGRTFLDQATLYWESDQKPPGLSSIASVSSNVTPTTKSSAELMKEIALLESEIIHLERYLLSLYRTVHEQNLPPLLENNGSYVQNNTGSALEVLADHCCYKIQPDTSNPSKTSHHQIAPACGFAGSDSPSFATPTKASSDKKNAHHDHRSLAQHLGDSGIVKAVNTPDRLSEDIVRCISSIYCKLANPTSTHSGFSVSSTSSMSSSGTFSPRNLSDSWSPQFNGEAAGHEQLNGLREETRPNAAMIEVLKICLDNDGFNFAARMLQKFRSLVKNLEEVDPGKMKREEKLAFWINIHNALVMHAYLAYGTHTHARSTSILKAAYNVGGQCINAYTIQNSILGIRSHYSQPWLQTLLSPGKKFKMGSATHVYAIEYPEPLVHFALSSGASSDPPVRVYTANNVFQDLKIARDEFIRATVHAHRETKVFLPKILDYFAKDMSLDMSGLLEVVDGSLFEDQRTAIIKCLKGRHDKYVHWLPHSSTFRYMFHRQLAEGIITSG